LEEVRQTWWTSSEKARRASGIQPKTDHPYVIPSTTVANAKLAFPQHSPTKSQSTDRARFRLVALNCSQTQASRVRANAAETTTSENLDGLDASRDSGDIFSNSSFSAIVCSNLRSDPCPVDLGSDRFTRTVARRVGLPARAEKFWVPPLACVDNRTKAYVSDETQAGISHLPHTKLQQ
jgi:hypothetical protein